MKSIRSKIMWLLFSTVLISSLIIGILGVALTSIVIEKSSNDNMNLLCKTNANEIDILLAKVEDSVDTLAHYAVSELPNKKELQDDSIRAKYLADLETSALHHIESTKSAMAVYIRFDDSYINDSDGFFFVKNENTAEFEKQPLTDISAYDENDTEHVGWWHIPTRNGEPTWIEAYYNANIKHEIISYIVPIYQHEQLVGVIGADISTDYIEQLVKNIYVFSSGKAAVLKSDGTVIYHPNFKRGELLGEGDAGFEGVVEKL